MHLKRISSWNPKTFTKIDILFTKPAILYHRLSHIRICLYLLNFVSFGLLPTQTALNLILNHKYFLSPNLLLIYLLSIIYHLPIFIINILNLHFFSKQTITLLKLLKKLSNNLFICLFIARLISKKRRNLNKIVPGILLNFIGFCNNLICRHLLYFLTRGKCVIWL
jgi:hypothetical protein